MQQQIVEGGYYLLQEIYMHEDGTHLRTLGAVDILRQVWIQQYYIEESKVSWREANNQPLAVQLIVSPYDLDVRCGQKRGRKWRGYKVHLTENCDPDSPNLIINVETTAAMAHDITIVPTVHENLAQKENKAVIGKHGVHHLGGC